MSDPRAQSTFQLRLDWGAAGLTRLAPSEIVVVVDAIETRGGLGPGAGQGPTSATDLAVRASELPHEPTVFIASLRTATATARAVFDEQITRGGRVAISLVLVGHGGDAAHGGDAGNFAVEDYLAAGAIGSSLSDLGLDHTSPELAVAIEGFRALGTATKHLFLASGSGQELKAAGRREELHAAATHDAEDVPNRFAR